MIYIPSLSKSDGGIYQYSIALIHLLKSDEYNEYFIYSQKKNNEIELLLSAVKKFNIIPAKECINSLWKCRFNRGINWIFSKYLGKRVDRIFSLSVNKCITKYRIDFLHCPYDDFPDQVNIPGITTIHDLQELVFPEYFTSEGRMGRAINRQRVINSASNIICSYDHIKNDIEKFFSESRGRVQTALLKMDNLWFSKYLDRDEINKEQRNKSAETMFILYPAATWEHKNHKNLLRAFNLLKDEIPNIHLICTGHKTNYFDDFIEPLIFELNLSKHVEFKGVVDDKSLFDLYKNCQAVIIPTKYEAGSFPLMEAMLMGVPVICSNVTSLPETIGSSQYIFNPNDIDDIYGKMSMIINDEKYRKSNKANSLIMKERLTSSEALLTFQDIYHSNRA